MKSSLQHLLISFIGSLLALACFVGILQLIDNYNDQTSASVNQQEQLIEAQKAWKKYSKTYDDVLSATLQNQNKSSYGKYDTMDKVRKHKYMTESISYLDYLMKQKGVKK